MRTKIMTDEVVTSVMNFISEGKTVPEISTLLGINKVTISSFLRTHGIKLHPDKGNVHYFDNIDSYAKAYIVGFIAADGALVKTKTTTTLTITIKYEDKAVLEFIKSEIGKQDRINASRFLQEIEMRKNNYLKMIDDLNEDLSQIDDIIAKILEYEKMKRQEKEKIKCFETKNIFDDIFTRPYLYF